MNKRQARLFAIVSTAICAVAFIGMTIDSHRQFDKLTNAENITPQVLNGKNVWHKYNCTNCHTLLGEGAYYAPDLTKITQHRGAPYLKAYMRDPSKFYDEQKHRRLMPKQNLADQEIDDLIVFLDWISHIDTQGWPPRPILVTGSSIPGLAMSDAQRAGKPDATERAEGARPVETSDSPIALGQALFSATPPGCFACHSTTAGVNLAGPSLAGVVAHAEQVIASPDYKGSAKDVEGYIRESIVNPNAYLHPGGMYSANGESFMPHTYGKDLKPEQIDQLVAYLGSLR
ncbi:MAG TPA: c-type cytochrome [Burkholderiales bacterium]